ncbi:MAG: glycosyltransferase family 9 protein, partial [Trebonia sp.]
MGDVLLTGPAVRAVAASGAEVTFVAGPSGAAAAALLPGVHQVLKWRAPWIDPEPGAFALEAVRSLVGG